MKTDKMKKTTYRKARLSLIMAVLFIFALPISAATYDSGGGGGDSSSSTVILVPDTPITGTAKTDKDKELDRSLGSGGKAVATTSADGKASFSPTVIDTLSDNGMPFTVEGQGVEIQFPPSSLNTSAVQQAAQNGQGTVDVTAKSVTESERQEILDNTPFGESTGIFEIGGRIINLSAALITSGGSTPIDSFAEPVAVTIDLSGLNLTPQQIAELTATRIVRNSDGTYSTVVLGGTYDANTGKFTFYTSSFSYYSVVQKKGLISISFSIGSKSPIVNGNTKTIDVAPMLINNRAMVPLRFIGEALGAEFKWNEKTKTVTITQGKKTLSLVIDQTAPGLDVAATIRNGRTLVPIRYISETFGAKVNWISSTHTIQVFK